MIYDAFRGARGDEQPQPATLQQQAQRGIVDLHEGYITDDPEYPMFDPARVPEDRDYTGLVCINVEGLYGPGHKFDARHLNATPQRFPNDEHTLLEQMRLRGLTDARTLHADAASHYPLARIGRYVGTRNGWDSCKIQEEWDQYRAEQYAKLRLDFVGLSLYLPAGLSRIGEDWHRQKAIGIRQFLSIGIPVIAYVLPVCVKYAESDQHRALIDRDALLDIVEFAYAMGCEGVALWGARDEDWPHYKQVHRWLRQEGYVFYGAPEAKTD